MPCTSEFNRWQDKYEAWRVASAEADGARNKALAADAAMVTACEIAIFTGGGGGFTAAACAAAVAALAVAMADLDTAVDKANIAADASNSAGDAYHSCIAKCRRFSK